MRHFRVVCLVKVMVCVIGVLGVFRIGYADSDNRQQDDPLASLVHPLSAVSSYYREKHVIPARLVEGDTVGLIASASAADELQIKIAKERLVSLGLKVKEGRFIHNAYYSFAGTDEERAQDLNDMFGDPEVKAIFEVRGGWGSKKILPHVDYELIRNHPKIIVGFSDITILLLAIYKNTGLVTFHGPMPGTTGELDWTKFTIESLNEVLFAGQMTTFINPKESTIRTIISGTARGKLIGGNLTVLTRMLNSKDLPDFNGAILFLEDISEPSRKIDGMLGELKDAGILDKISGFIFGSCADCDNQTSRAKKVDQLLDEYIKPLGKPAWSNAMIGHTGSMWTLPVGSDVEIDADHGTITMLEEAVK